MTTPAQQAALVGALERARRALEAAETTLEQARSAAARGETQLDVLGDAARGAPIRGREVRASLGLFYEALERAKLSALNAGLEAGRLGDPAGKIVLELAGDLRELVSGALAALEAHSALLAEAERERERWLDGVSQARDTIRTLAKFVNAGHQQRQELASAFAAVEQGVAPVLGADPKTVRLLLEVNEQSKALARNVDALSREPGAASPERLREALAPLLEALDKDEASVLPNPPSTVND
jgi:methyl-accepting chemotaxis protein